MVSIDVMQHDGVMTRRPTRELLLMEQNLTIHISAEIIGCCEIIEERIDTSQRSSTRSERERRQTARHRPIIENLCVKEGYRKCGVGIALIQACENAVVQFSRGGCDEVFTQVESGNSKAYNLFRKCGYQDHFTDPTCTIVALDISPFASKEIASTPMLRISS